MTFTGFKPLKLGRMHLVCPECNRKMSNAHREEYDPPDAEVAAVLCPRCCDKTCAHEPITDYYRLTGEQVSPFPEVK